MAAEKRSKAKEKKPADTLQRRNAGRVQRECCGCLLVYGTEYAPYRTHPTARAFLPSHLLPGVSTPVAALTNTDAYKKAAIATPSTPHTYTERTAEKRNSGLIFYVL